MSIEEYQDFTTVYANGFYNGEEKWKNKIRAKIKQIEDAIEPWGDEDLRYQLKIKDKAQIEVLKELLEEE